MISIIVTGKVPNLIAYGLGFWALGLGLHCYLKPGHDPLVQVLASYITTTPPHLQMAGLAVILTTIFIEYFSLRQRVTWAFVRDNSQRNMRLKGMVVLLFPLISACLTIYGVFIGDLVAWAPLNPKDKLLYAFLWAILGLIWTWAIVMYVKSIEPMEPGARSLLVEGLDRKLENANAKYDQQGRANLVCLLCAFLATLVETVLISSKPPCPMAYWMLAVFCLLPSLAIYLVGGMRARVAYMDLLHLCDHPYQTVVIVSAIFLGAASFLTVLLKILRVLSTGVQP